MGLNLSREKEKQDALKSKGGKSRDKGWQPQDGPNVIRVLPFTHKVTKEDVAAKLYGKSEIGKTMTEWQYEVVMHFGLTAKNYPVKSNDEIMALYSKLRKSKSEEDLKRADRIKPSRKYAMNIIDLNNPEGGVQLYVAPKTVREFVGDHLIDPDFGEAILGAKGRDIKIEYNSKSTEAAGFYKLKLQDKDKCRAISSKVTDKVQDLFDQEVNSLFVEAMSGDISAVAPGNGEVFDPSKPEPESEKVKEKAKEKAGSFFDED